jgi:hypothetical protein
MVAMSGCSVRFITPNNPNPGYQCHLKFRCSHWSRLRMTQPLNVCYTVEALVNTASNACRRMMGKRGVRGGRL